jgi:CheY-specific phosphatase CheX
MKKSILFILLAVILISQLGCSASGESTIAVVLGTSGETTGSISFYTTQSDNYAGDLASASITEDTKLVDENGKAISLSDIVPGDLIQITHSGVVQEMYPPNYPEVYEVQVQGAAEEDLYALALERQHEWESQFPE